MDQFTCLGSNISSTKNDSNIDIEKDRETIIWKFFVFEESKIFQNVTVSLILFTNPSAWAGYYTRSIFKRSLTGLNSEFSFSYTSCLTKAEEPSLSYYLPIAGGRKIGFIPFPRLLVLCEMQSFSSRIWTRVVVSISYDDNHYTTGTSNCVINTVWLHQLDLNETSEEISRCCVLFYPNSESGPLYGRLLFILQIIQVRRQKTLWTLFEKK